MAAEDDEFERLFSNGGTDIDTILSGFGEKATVHAVDAVDFESEDELAEEEANNEPDPQGDWNQMLATFGEDSEQPQDNAQEEEDKRREREQVLLNIHFPEFVKSAILKMNTLFGPKPSYLELPQPRGIRTCAPSRLRLDVEPDTRTPFRSLTMKPAARTGIIEVEPPQPEAEEIEVEEDKKASQFEDVNMETADWDYLLDEDNVPAPRASKDVYLDDIYDSEEEDKLLEGTLELPKHVQVNMNDSHLLFADRPNTRNHKQLLAQNRYNISNDKAYDMLKENYQNKVRSTIGNLTIDHALVALRLQSPFYRVNLSKQQMRSWHRPKLSVKPGQSLTFSPLKSRKKKKDKNKPITQLLARSSDLTLGDNAPLFLVEYSEEFPLVLSNVGMGSKLINYYRKKNANDISRPKLPLGETHVLDVQDRSAFWNFGFVEAGNVVPTLYNQLIRAPVFRHEPRKTDFLLIRSFTKARGSKYFVRPIPHLFVAGQTFPVTQIPGPHSRKVTTASKNRLKMIVYRVLNKSPLQRLQVKDVSGYFPDQNDMQNRQRLKEFMEFQRSGEDQSYWKIKQGDTLPTEETIRSMIQPEDIALLEAMQVGQQHLEDSGYGKTVDDDKNDAAISLEEQLAPWNISRNFINAIQGKAMLQLHGEGDPTSRGEGFSFLRTSMKGGFKAMHEANEKVDKSKLGGHSYNVALQQKAYDEEIRRIWYAQERSLKLTDVSKLPPQKKPEDEDAIGGTGPNKKVLRITRMVKDENDVVVRRTEIVTDPNVIRAYMKRRQVIEDAQIAPDDISVSTDEERNVRSRKILETELARLRRNLDRRMNRKATKGDGKGTKAKATTRKCATCGAVGHIKTNKSCPMYNDIYLGGQPS